VYYSVRTRSDLDTCDTVASARGHVKVILPPQHVGQVQLTASQSGYQQVAGDEFLHMLIPQSPLYPGSRLYVPVFVEQPQEGVPVSVVVIKCRARRGVKIEGIEETSEDWTLRIDLNSRGSIATVTAFRKDANKLGSQEDKKEYAGPHELFNWLYAIDESESELYEGGLLVWHVKYQHLDQDLLEQDINTANITKNSRIRHRLDINKDDVQIVLPISKSWEMMNTAVLTGRQVSQSMKVFMVSEAGSVADVTLHTSCTTADHSALKVSSSCTSVYVDGSETRGALNAEVKIKYGTFSGQAYFTVWMAEMPLDLVIPDDNLSQIKSWKIPGSIEKGYQKRAAELQNNWRDIFEKQTKKFDEKRTKLIEEIEEDEHCQTRYQQTTIKVFARFLAEDPDSGRRDYLISRTTMLDVTDLTMASVRVSDPRVASVMDGRVQGHTPGSVNITILSPITSQVLGWTEIKVTKTKETITGLKARVLSGISMAVTRNLKIHNQFTLETFLSEKLSNKYQEGLLDITLMFSDGSSTPLRDIDSDQYYLTVDTLDSRVIAFAPILGSKDTRVIAVGKGRGELLKVSLELADDCHDKNDDPLATANVYVEVDFEVSDLLPQAKDDRQVAKGRKGRGRRRKDHNKEPETSVKTVNMGDLSEMFMGNIALGDDNSRVSSSDMFSFDARSPPVLHDSSHHQVTPLEVGMYILLGVFCVAIAVFMASCFVYASKHQQPNYPLQNKSQSVQNAHDWVWLGRQTLDKSSSVATSGSREAMLDTNANSLHSRDRYRHHPHHHHQQPQYPPHHQGYKFEATADVNIIQNPCTGTGAGAEYGFVNKRGLKVSNYSPDVYAELPRKRWPSKQTSSPQPSQIVSQLYQNHPHQQHHSSHENRSPYLSRKHQRSQNIPDDSSSSSSTPSLEHVSLPVRHVESPCPSSQSSRVNSATYTRKKPVVPAVDILPVGYPVYDSQNYDDEASGFQNPWEALQMYANDADLQTQKNKNYRLHEFFEDDEQIVPLQLKLDLDEPPPYDTMEQQPELRQSPASALPPYEDDSDSQNETTYVITPEHIKKPRGEYIPLNPDINKPNPPRIGASKMFSDPFNVSDDDAPPVTRELLSPSHIFSSIENINREFAEAASKHATSELESETDNGSVTDVSVAEDNCSSVCSADSGELEDDLPDPNSLQSPSGSLSRNRRPEQSPYGSLSRSRDITDNSSAATATDLNSVPLGSLDYEHLMNYFESLKESAA